MAGRLFLSLLAEVKVCDYCGRENADDAAHCGECGGTTLSGTVVPPPIPSVAPAIALPPPLPPLPLPLPVPPGAILRAGTATMVLLAYFGAQFAGGIVGAVLGGGIKAASRKADPVGGGAEDTIMGLAVLFALIASGVAMVLASIALLRDRLRDTSVTGAAWVTGSFKQMAQGFGVGTLVAIGYCVLAIPFVSKDAPVGPLTKMAMTPGLMQMAWLLMALLFAPPIEELLFRGVLYGGYRQTFGPKVAAISTTAIFTLLHITEIVHSWFAGVAIIALALTALSLRLRYGAIGPAVAAHLGYNSVMSLITVVTTLIPR